MRRALVAAMAVVAGCYSPSFDNPTCPTGECPSGFTCVQGQCVSGNGDIDARVDADETSIDAPPTDMATDTPMGTTHVATISVVETQLLSPSGGIFGQGVTINTTFAPTAGNLPVVDTAPGLPTGCKVYEQTTGATIAAAGGINEGTVSVTVTDPAMTPPVFPPCAFNASTGIYQCIDVDNSGSFASRVSSLNNVSPSVWALAIPGKTFAAEDVGRQIFFAGTGHAFLDGKGFSIVGFSSPTTIAIAIPSGVGTNVSISQGTFTTIAGGAINPAVTSDPGTMTDNASVMVMVDSTAAGSGGHFGSFSANITNVGDDFTMDGPTTMRMTNIPRDGTPFVIGCSGCSGALGSILNIVTTDAALPAGDAFAMPRAVSKRVQIQCAEIAATSIMVPASVSARLQQSGATRIQTAFLRVDLQQPTTNAGTAVSVVAGHSIVGFTTAP